MPRAPVVIRLELDLSGDALAGRASDGAGREKVFAGWLGLMAAIEALLPTASSLEASIAAPDDGESP